MIFQKRYRYRFGDIDDAGIAYYPSFFHYFHGFFEDWWEEGLGIPYAEVLHGQRFGLPVVRVECDFRRPIRYGATPDFSLGILEIGGKSLRFGYSLTLGEAQESVCAAEIVTVATSMDTMEAIELPERWLPRFREYQVERRELPGFQSGAPEIRN